MSNPEQRGRSFEPMIHNDDSHPEFGNGQVWNFGQRPMAAHISPYNQEDTPLVLRTSESRVEGSGFVSQGAAASIESAAKSTTITPGTAEIGLKGSSGGKVTVTATLTVTSIAPVQQLERPPASGLISALKRILTCVAFDRIIAPYVAQEQHEYYEALVRKDLQQAKWIRVRMYLLLTWLSFRAFVSPVIRLITRAG